MPIDLHALTTLPSLPSNATGDSVLVAFCTQLRALADRAASSSGVEEALTIVISMLRSSSAELTAEAVGAIGAVVAKEPSHRATVLRLGGLEPIVALVVSGGPARALALRTLTYLGDGDAERSHALAQSLRASEALPAVVSAAEEGPLSEASYWAAMLLKLLAALSADECDRLVDAGVAAPLLLLACSTAEIARSKGPGPQVPKVAGDALASLLAARAQGAGLEARERYIRAFGAATRALGSPARHEPPTALPELVAAMKEAATQHVQAAQESDEAERLEDAITFGRWCGVPSDTFGAARARQKDRERERERHRQLEVRRAELGKNAGASQKAALKKADKTKRQMRDPSTQHLPKHVAALQKENEKKRGTPQGGTPRGAAVVAAVAAAAAVPCSTESFSKKKPSGWAGLRKMSQTAQTAAAFSDTPEEHGFAAALQRGGNWFGDLFGGFAQSLRDSFSIKQPAGSFGKRGKSILSRESGGDTSMLASV